MELLGFDTCIILIISVLCAVVYFPAHCYTPNTVIYFPLYIYILYTYTRHVTVIQTYRTSGLTSLDEQQTVELQRTEIH